MNHTPFRIFKSAVLLGLVCALPCGSLAASDTNAAGSEASIKTAEILASTEALRAYVQFQEQLREAQVTLERARRDAQEAAAQSAQMWSNRLESIEHSLAAQRDSQTRTTEALQSTTHFMLVALITFAVVGFIAIVLTAFFQWRTINRLAEISGASSGRPFGLPAFPALGAGDAALAEVDPTDTRLAGAVDRLEKRLAELEHSTAAPAALPEPTIKQNGGEGPVASETPTVSSAEFSVDKQARSKALVDRGQALLNQDKPDEAVECFDQAIALDANNADALVKKGTALEKLRKLTDAIECYDRAIALDGSLTIAYLHKGGLFNRMERFSEAVDCYEQALRTQEKRRAA